MINPNYKYFQLTETEDLIFEKGDWEDEEWKTIIKIFNSGRDAERIVIKSPYKIQGYGDNGYEEETYGGDGTGELRNMLRRESKKI